MSSAIAPARSYPLNSAIRSGQSSTLVTVLGCCFILTVVLSGASRAQDWQWARSAGGSGGEYALDVAVDRSGNSYVIGQFSSSSVTFGGTTLLNANPGLYDIFVAKYDQGGNAVWASGAGGSLDDQGFSAATDSSGNLYVTGFFKSSSITFGSFTLTNANAGTYDMFAVKYSPDGTAVWAKREEGTDNVQGRGVAADDSGNCYVTGEFSGPSITVGTTTLTNNGGADIFIVKYDGGGAVRWARGAGGGYNDEPYDMAGDGQGNSYITGQYSSLSMALGSDTLTNIGPNENGNIFLVKYDRGGNAVWARSAGGSSDDRGIKIAADRSGNTAVTGYFLSTTAAFGDSSVTNVGNKDFFVARYNGSGVLAWVRSAGGIEDDNGWGAAINDSGNCYVSGFFASPTMTIGGRVLTNASAGHIDGFVAEYDAGGDVRWASGFGGSLTDYGYGLAIDGRENIHLAGQFNSASLPFGRRTLTNAQEGTFDMFIAKTGVTIRSVTPSQNAINVPGSANISATFSRPMNTATLNASDILVHGSESGQHAGSISLSGDTAFSFDPAVDFKPGEIVTAALTKNILSAGGDSLANGYLWQFTAGASGGNAIFTLTDTLQIGSFPLCVAAADFDRNGLTDFAAANGLADSVSILLQTAPGVFSRADYKVGTGPRSVVVGDFDGDGKPDIAVANAHSNSVSIGMNTGSGFTFDTLRVDGAPSGLAAGDWDGDGDPDLATANNDSNSVSILLNDGTGHFTAVLSVPAGSKPLAVASGDFDRDGSLDLAVADYLGRTVPILGNDGTGHFARTSTADAGLDAYSVSSFDCDHDGALDLVVTSYDSSKIAILKNDGLGNFTRISKLPSGFQSTATCTGDFDQDGDLDLATANSGVANVSLLTGDGSCAYTFLASPGVGLGPNFVISADVDNDGDLDLVTANANGHSLTILRNDLRTSIAGTKFNDINHNGQRDNGEPGIPGWRIFLSGAASETTATDPDGNYAFDGLSSGTYSVCEEELPGWHQTLPLGCYSLPLTAGQNLTGKDFGNTQLRATLTVCKLEDADGNFSTSGDRSARNWHLEIRKDSLDGPLMASGNDPCLVESTLASGNYIAMEADSSGWVTLGSLADGVPSRGPAQARELSLTGGQSATITFVNAPPVYSQQYRTFTLEKLAEKKALKKKTSSYRFQAVFRNAMSQDANGLEVHFGGSLTFVAIDSAQGFATKTQLSNRSWVFSDGIVRAGDSVMIRGVGYPGKIVSVFTWFWKVNSIAQPTQRGFKPANQRPLLPMPNYANVRDDLYKQNAFGSSGLLVGVDKSADSARKFGWVRLLTSPSMQSSLCNRGTCQTAAARCFDNFAGLKRSLSPSRYGNRLFGNLVPLKFSIRASEMGKTPPGLGDLIFRDTADNALNGLTVKRIALLADSLLKGFYAGSLRQCAGAATLENAANVIEAIDSAFDCPIDTDSYGVKLRLTGCRRLADVPYLHANPNSPPVMNPIVEPDIDVSLPFEYRLFQNYPNPFNPSTMISFRLPVSSLVTLRIYNTLGQEVATLLNNEPLDEGDQEVEFNAEGLATGVYFYRLVAEAGPDEAPARFVETRKLLLLR